VIPGLVVSACALLAAAGFGFGWRGRNGRVRATAPRAAVSANETQAPSIARASIDGATGQRASHAAELTVGDLGAPLGSKATLVQFSSAFCAPCRATRQVLSDVATMVDGVSHVEIDAESRLDLVRRLDVRRTPTTFVLGPGGEITHRASGKPRKADVLAALGAVI